MSLVTIYTDGACSGNPGPGGWGVVILRDNGVVEELAGGSPQTTNNRMELQAAIEALKAMPEGQEVALYTDSTYVRDGITQWIQGWKRNGWRNAAKEEVKNKDLWMILDALSAARQVTFHWVKAHAGHVHNERADLLARNAIVQVIMSAPLSLEEEESA